MKVLFATNHAYLPQRVGGSESSTHDLCLTLRECGVEVAVLSGLMPWRAIDGKLHPHVSLRWGGSILRDDTQGYSVFRATEPTLAVPALVREHRPTVAVIQAGRPLTLAARFVELGIPTIVYLRDAWFDDLGGAVPDHLGIRYVATSRDLARRFAEAFGIVPVHLPPLVRPERYQVQSRRRNVTFVCPHPAKGVGIALQLARRRRDVPFLFVESWQLHPVRRVLLRWQARAAGDVTWHLRTLDMRTVYRDTRILLVPSRWIEAWGRVVSEAQTSAIPVLASDCGGLPESVGDGGVLVDAGAGIEDWERALSRMWDDPIEYEHLAERARQHALRPEFQPSTIASRLQALFAEVIAR